MVGKKKKVKKWAGPAFGENPGALKRQLFVPKNETIPIMLMRDIENTSVEEYGKKKVRNGKHWITVTRLLVERVRPVLRMREARLAKKK